MITSKYAVWDHTGLDVASIVTVTIHSALDNTYSLKLVYANRSDGLPLNLSDHWLMAIYKSDKVVKNSNKTKMNKRS